MIQRIQSLFLLIAALLFLVTFFFRPIIASETLTWLFPTVVGIHAVVALVAIWAIFLFNNRKQQLKIVTLLQFLALIAIISVFAGAYMTGLVNDLPGNTLGIVMLVLPMVGYVLIRLAGQRIKKDIELVRSVDRLRP